MARRATLLLALLLVACNSGTAPKPAQGKPKSFACAQPIVLAPGDTTCNALLGGGKP